MGFRRSDLQEAFFVAGTYGFRVWGYGTTDPLEEVLRQDYFEAVRGLLSPGELIYVSAQRAARNQWVGVRRGACGSGHGSARRAGHGFGSPGAGFWWAGRPLGGPRSVIRQARPWSAPGKPDQESA